MLDVDCNVAGLDEEVPDAGGGVLHHQLAGSVVVLGAAVADTSQQVIDLVAETALRQSYVQHGLFGFLLLYRRERGAQAVQLVEIDRKADGPRARGELLHQQVIPPALEHRTGKRLQIALKHKAVVIFHLTGQRHVQTDAAACTSQLFGDGFQLGSGGFHPLVPAGGFHTGKHILTAAAEAHQPRQRVGIGLIRPGGGCRRFQLVEVFRFQLCQQGGAGSFRHVQRIQQTEQVAHVAHFQHPRLAQLLEGLCCQRHRLPHLSFAHIAQHLKAHLADLLEGMAFCRGAVDIFVIVVAQCLTRRGLRRLGNGEGHVRFQCQQPPVQIGEGDDLLRREEAAVLLIQPVLLEPAHVIFAAARRLVQRPQRERGLLLRL